MSCELCGKSVDFKGFLVTKPSEVGAVSFLKGKTYDDSSSIEVCQSCQTRIQVIVSVQKEIFNPSQTLIAKTSTDIVDASEAQESHGYSAHDEGDGVETDVIDAFQDAKEIIDKSLLSKQEKKVSTEIEESLRQRRKSRNESVLTCQLCPATLRRVATLRRHYISQHHYEPTQALIQEEYLENKPVEKGSFVCKECSTSFGDKNVLIKHILYNHVGHALTTFKCKHCEKTYRYERDLKTHQERLCRAVVGQFQECEVCLKKFTSSHIRAHLTYTHKCRLCDHISKDREAKVRHLEEEHSDELHDICTQCGERFETADCLIRHQRRAHSKKFVRCPRVNCKQIFVKGSSRLKKHLVKFHNPENEAIRASYKFECQYCKKRIKTKSLLQSHIAVKHNTEGAVFKCPYCDYVVPRKRRSDVFRYHIPRTHMEKADVIQKEKERIARKKEDQARRARVQCFLCPFAGTRANNMTRHYVEAHDFNQALVNEETPDKEFPDGTLCPECGEHFVNRHAQIHHLIKIHSKSTGEQCLFCNNRYFNLEEHIDAMHEEEKSAAIQFCKKCTPEQRFTSFEDLLRHARSYHRKKPNASDIEQSSTSNTGKSKTKEQSSNQDDSGDKQRLCENCGKTVAPQFMSRHKSECPKLAKNESTQGKRYVPVHLSGICPFCDKKFSDLLGHIRHGHNAEKKSESATTCVQCNEKFGSVRELVNHRQLHPTFKSHFCIKCKAPFETIVELRTHRMDFCPKRKKKPKKLATSTSQNQANTLQQASEDTPALNSTATTGSTTANDPSDPSLQIMNDLLSLTGNTPSAATSSQPPKSKPIEYEGRGTVSCHLCTRTFTMKVLLRRHYISHHDYKPELASSTITDANLSDDKASKELECPSCGEKCINRNAWIKHQLDFHTLISGEICPYCDSKWGPKKFDSLDEHVHKYHFWDIQSPIQQCSSCKAQFNSYEQLKVHRQIHDKRVVELNSGSQGSNGLLVHSRVGAKSEITNRGGVKCLLCNMFKLRKDHLKTHYIKHHGYDPKLAIEDESRNVTELSTGEDETMSEPVSCPSCHQLFTNNHKLIRHILKNHCSYTGLICPYCRGHHPERYIDLQSHVTTKHIDKLTGYNVDNSCKVCKEKFSGYAELRDHVQIHGDGFREPYGNPEVYRENAKKRKRKHNETAKVSEPNLSSPAKPLATALPITDSESAANTTGLNDDLQNVSLSSFLFKEILETGIGTDQTLEEKEATSTEPDISFS